MKYLVLLYLALTVLIMGEGWAQNTVHDQLKSVNAQWAFQKDGGVADISGVTANSQRDWIAVHLSLVEDILRLRSTEHLNEVQRYNRAVALQHLNTYWKSRVFPVNERYGYQTPIFIDDNDRFCAVGYLLKATGHEQVARMIAAVSNLGYVKEMHHPEVFIWASEYGFTVDELAWIQPAYEPANIYKLNQVTQQIDGKINGLQVSWNGEALYLAGDFKYINDTLEANGVCMVTVDASGGYAYTTVAEGIIGEAYVMKNLLDGLYVAGDFKVREGDDAGSIARYVSGTWEPLGCVNGVVKDVVAFEEDLYIIGDFEMCDDGAEPVPANFARWNGVKWESITGADGDINAIDTFQGKIYLGGYFEYDGQYRNIAGWTASGGFYTFDLPHVHEINTFGRDAFGDVLVAGGSSLGTENIEYGLMYYSGTGDWMPVVSMADQLSLTTGGIDIRALEKNQSFTTGGHLLCGGTYQSGDEERHLFFSNNPDFLDEVALTGLTGSINSIAFWNHHFFIAGGFRFSNDSAPFDNLAKLVIDVRYGKVRDNDVPVVSLFPNPVSEHIVYFDNHIRAERLEVYNALGQKVLSSVLKAGLNNIDLNVLNPGLYYVTLYTDNDMTGRSRLIIQ